MQVYRISVCERYVGTGNFSLSFRREKLFVVDGVGICVYYDPDTPEVLEKLKLDPEKTGIKEIHVYVQAKNLLDAIKSFHEEWPGAKRTNECADPSLWINMGEAIYEYPPCTKLHLNKDGRFICGEEVGSDGNGDFGCCVLEECVPFDGGCPIKDYQDELERRKRGGALFISWISGFRVIRAEQLLGTGYQCGA